MFQCPKCNKVHKPELPIKGYSHPCPANRGKHVDFRKVK